LVTNAIQDLATKMATNGAQSSRVQFALDSLNVNQVNLEAALSRIQDVDVAAETAKLARANILVQAGAAMLTQANASQSIALKLLQ
jgi:flagellin